MKAGIFLAKFFRTKEQAVERLSEMMRADEEESEDEVFYIDEPDDKSEGIYGHISFLNHEIDYVAKAIDDLSEL